MLVVGGDYPMALAVKANRDLTLRIEEARSTPPSQGLRMLTQGASNQPRRRRGRVLPLGGSRHLLGRAGLLGPCIRVKGAQDLPDDPFGVKVQLVTLVDRRAVLDE